MKTLQFTLPTVVFVFFFGATFWFVTHAPTSDRMPKPKATQLSVETSVVKPQSYVVHVSSFGSVKPRIQGEIIAEVSGKITYVNDQFREGGYFQAEQTLLKIDPTPYQLEVRIAEAALNTAKQAFIEEQARADVAKQEWKLSGQRNSAGTSLALREPQLETARAAIETAQAKLDIARLNLSRTTIKAPYSGRILKKFADIGQVIANGKKLADVFATDFIEIRLPIKNNDLPFVDLPETVSLRPKNDLPNVVFSSDLLSENQVWHGRLVRTESAIDDNSQQLNVVAQIDNPYGANNGQLQLKIGQFLTADITGKTVENAIVVPNSSIYQGSYLYVVEDSKLQRRNISILWQNDQQSLIGSGLAVNDELVVTPIGQVVSGTSVVVLGKENQRAEGTHRSQAKMDGEGEPRKGERKHRKGRENESGDNATVTNDEAAKSDSLVNAIPQNRAQTP